MTGKRVSYIRCPYCAFSSVLYSQKYEGGKFRLGELKTAPSEFPIIEIREALPGPGRGHKGRGRGGIQIVETLDIVQALEHQEYSDIATQVKHRIINIIRSYIDASVINEEEIL